MSGVYLRQKPVLEQLCFFLQISELRAVSLLASPVFVAISHERPFLISVKAQQVVMKVFEQY
jgi:hypothetical protein